MKKLLLSLISLLILTNLCAQYGDNDDFDGDGILNINDIDDDNDGILDSLENYEEITRKVTQSSTSFSGVASRAIDGNTNGAWSGSSVTHTAFQTNAWLELDLGVIYDISNIKLYTRTDNCCIGRLTDYHIFVSDEPFSSTDLNATINDNTVYNNHQTGTAGSPTTISPNRTGRYVRVQLANANYLSIAELVVEGSFELNADSDGDGIPNRFDIDSDDDGCPDAFESSALGATNSGLTTDSIFSGSVGNNGLYNSLENNDSQNASTIYTPNYSLALDGDNHNCQRLLPIELIDFSVRKQNNDVAIKWETATEINNDFFEVERSKNAKDWNTISIVNGAGNSNEVINYNDIDASPLQGISYYRLKQTDFDGQFSYSAIKSIEFNTTNETINIYPNPANDYVILSSSALSTNAIQVFNTTGKRIDIEITKLNENEVQINLSQFSRGIYFVKFKGKVYKIQKN